VQGEPEQSALLQPFAARRELVADVEQRLAHDLALVAEDAHQPHLVDDEQAAAAVVRVSQVERGVEALRDQPQAGAFVLRERV
jgi:hypothetical protein